MSFVVVDTSKCVAFTTEEIAAKAEVLAVDKLDAKTLDQLLFDYEFKVMRMELQLKSPDISVEKQEIIIKKLDNRREAYFIMLKQWELVV